MVQLDQHTRHRTHRLHQHRCQCEGQEFGEEQRRIRHRCDAGELMHPRLPVAPQRSTGIENDEDQHEEDRGTLDALYDLIGHHVSSGLIHQIHEPNHEDHETDTQQAHDDEKGTGHHLSQFKTRQPPGLAPVGPPAIGLLDLGQSIQRSDGRSRHGLFGALPASEKLQRLQEL